MAEETLEFRKDDRRYPVSIQRATPDVPDDGKYHVLDDGVIVLSTGVLDLAQITFDERRERHRIAAGHPDPGELLRQESGLRAAQSLRGDSIRHQSRRSSRGGPGGRVGVG